MKTKLITTGLLSVILTACGGGDGSNNNPQSKKDDTPVMLSDFASNVWEYTLKEEGKSYDFYMLFSTNGSGEVYHYRVEDNCYSNNSANISKENDKFIFTDADNEKMTVTIEEDILTLTHTEGNTIEKIHWNKSDKESSDFKPLCKS